MGSTGEETDRGMLAPDLVPHPPRLLGQSRFKPCSSMLMMERKFIKLTCQYLVGQESIKFCG